MAEWCLNYETGDYDYIEKDGFCQSTGEYTYNFDDSPYRNNDNDDDEDD